MTQDLKVSADPTKDFFIHMLTRDIGLSRSILDHERLNRLVAVSKLGTESLSGGNRPRAKPWKATETDREFSPPLRTKPWFARNGARSELPVRSEPCFALFQY